MITTSALINNLKKYLGLKTDKELAEYWDIPVRRIQTWKSRNSPISFREIINFCLQNSMDLNAIFYGKPISQKVNGCPATHIQPPASAIKHADYTSDQIVDVLHINREWAHHVLGITEDNLVEIRIAGNNMMPWVAEGDVVFIDISHTAVVTDAPYVLKYGNTLVVKRLIRHSDGSIVAKSDSQYCEDELFPPDCAPHIVGRVIRRLVR